ncbi:MAG: hypothetical protein GY711_34140 [bacterium]|nr:hypothetical protein [bacterium]
MSASIAAIAVSGGRGLAAVRAAVLAEVPVAGASAALVPAATAVIMNKSLAASLGVVLIAAAGWSLRTPDGSVPGPAEPETAHAPAPDPVPPPAQTTPATATRTAATAGTAELGAAARATGGAIDLSVVYAGEGVPTAGIEYALAPQHDPSNAVCTGSTDTDGHATMEDLAPSMYVLDLALPTGPQRTPLLIEKKRHELTLEIERGWSLVGSVVDRDGRAIAGAAVQIEVRTGPAATLAHSAADGTFRVEHLRDDIEIWALASGRQPSQREQLEKRHGQAEVRLVVGEPGSSLTGMVEDEQGRAIGGALVSIGIPLDLGSHFVQRQLYALTTAPDGSFAADWLPEGNVFVGAMPPGRDRERAAAEWIEISAHAPARVRLALGSGARLAGRVTDGAGAAVAQAQVFLSHQGETGLEDFGWASTMTDDEGRYALAGLIPGRYQGFASRGAIREEIKLEIAPQDDRRWDVTLATGHSLHVHVVNSDGQPFVTCEVQVQRPDPHLDWVHAGTESIHGSGSPATFHDLEPLGHRVYVLFGKHRSLGVRRDDVVPDDGEITIRLEPDQVPTAQIRGRVVDARGNPVPDAKVTMQQSGWPRVANVVVDQVGGFTVEDLVPGTYRLTARAPGAKMAHATTGERELGPNEELDLGDLVLPDGARLEVNLAADDGGPVTAPVLVLTQMAIAAKSPGGVELEWDEVDDVWRSPSLAPEMYELRFFAADARPEVFDIELVAGKTRRLDVTAHRAHPVVLELRFAKENEQGMGLLNGDIQIEDADGRRVITQRLFGYFDDFEKRLQHVHIALEAGKYRILAKDYWTKNEASVEVTVPAEGPLEVDLR